MPAITYARVSPLSHASYALQCTLSAEAHAMLREVQDLLGPRVARGDVPQVLELAFAALLQQLNRKRKAELLRPTSDASVESAEPRTGSGSHVPMHDPRHIPAHVCRAVWARDADCCQFVSATGRRCESRSGLEIDHVDPVSLGGTSTLDNLRLLCRAHNQLEAERRLGRGFMYLQQARLRPVAPTA